MAADQIHACRLRGRACRLEESTVESIFIHAVYLINCASYDAEIGASPWSRYAHALRIGDGIGAEGLSSTRAAGRVRRLRRRSH